MAKFEQQKNTITPIMLPATRHFSSNSFLQHNKTAGGWKARRRRQEKGLQEGEEGKSRQSSISRVCKKSATTVYSIKLFRLSLSFLVGTALMRTESSFSAAVDSISSEEIVFLLKKKNQIKFESASAIAIAKLGSVLLICFSLKPRFFFWEMQ